MKDKVRQYLKDNDLYFNLDPSHDRTYKGYKERLREKLPQLYQFLVDEKVVESGKFNQFTREIFSILQIRRTMGRWHAQ
jgi:hypothetical protein